MAPLDADLLREAGDELKAQDEEADSLTRAATTLLGLTGVVIPLVVRVDVQNHRWLNGALVLFASSGLSGLSTFLFSRRREVAQPVQLLRWVGEEDSRLVTAALLVAKQMAFLVNEGTLRVRRGLWWAQIGSFVLALVTSFLYVRRAL
jgi:hypothetical protein